MMDKKGAGVGQVFLFIIAAITFSLIMIFGYKAISGFLVSGDKVAFVQFKTDLESSIQRIYTEFGSVRIKDFNAPVKYEQICFVDLDANFNEDLCEEDLLACSVWRRAKEDFRGYDEENVNVFMTPPAPVPIKVFRIGMENDFLCLDIINGRFSLLLEGRGDHTSLSLPTREGQ